MNSQSSMKRLLPALLALPLLAACGHDQPASAPDSSAQTQPETLLGKMVADKTTQIRQSLQHSSLMIGGGQGIRFNIQDLDDVAVRGNENDAANLPLLEITANGELRLNQQPIPLSAEQQALTARYHQQAQQIADAGLDIAIAGVDFGGSALTQLASGFLSGKSPDQLEVEMTAQAEQLKSRARGLCQQIDGLMRIQNQIAEAVPEFTPYAVLEADTLEKCLQDAEVGITDDGQAVAP